MDNFIEHPKQISNYATRHPSPFTSHNPLSPWVSLIPFLSPSQSRLLRLLLSSESMWRALVPFTKRIIIIIRRRKRGGITDAGTTNFVTMKFCCERLIERIHKIFSPTALFGWVLVLQKVKHNFSTLKRINSNSQKPWGNFFKIL